MPLWAGGRIPTSHFQISHFRIHLALCPLPYGLCPLRRAPCAVPYAPCSITRIVFHLP